MLRKIQGKKLSKKANYKQNFKKFIDSGYTNTDAFKPINFGFGSAQAYKPTVRDGIIF